MLDWIHKIRVRMKEWAERQVHKTYVVWTLAFVSFAESSFLPFPPDFLLVPLVLLRRKKWLYYATVVVVSSVLGGVLGYIIGFYFFDTIGQSIVNLYGLGDKVASVTEFFASSGNSFVVVFLSAFTFIPYKVFTITSGIFQANIWIFIIASVIGRGVRFFLEAYLVYKFGEIGGKKMYKYFAITVVAALILIFLLFYFVL